MSIPVAGVVVIFVILVFPDVIITFLPFVVALPFLVGQEIMRFACAVQSRMRVALVLDTIWLVCVALFLGVVSFAVPKESIQAWHIASAWAGSGIISFGVGSILIPWKRGAAGAFAQYLAQDFIGRRFLVEFLAMRGASQSLGLALGGLSGAVAAGAYRGASTLSGPLAVLLGTVSSFGAPLLRSVDIRRRTYWLMCLSLILALLAGVWTLALSLLPDSIGRFVLGETWDVARNLIIPIALQTVALGVSIPFIMALRVHWPRVTLWVQLAGSVLTVALFFSGLLICGVVGAAWGQFLAASLQAILVCITYFRFSKRSRS